VVSTTNGSKGEESTEGMANKLHPLKNAIVSTHVANYVACVR